MTTLSFCRPPMLKGHPISMVCSRSGIRLYAATRRSGSGLLCEAASFLSAMYATVWVLSRICRPQEEPLSAGGVRVHTCCESYNKGDIYVLPGTYTKLLFERSEFLFATSQETKLCVCRVSCVVCSTNIGFSVGYACVRLVGFSVGYVFCTTYVRTLFSRYVCTWYQPGGREQWTVLSGTSTIGHGLHVADRAQGLTGT